MSKRRMTTRRDKRSKLDLELFVLALVLRDVNTPYALLSTAGLSPGATIPVLTRLEESGSLRRGTPGSRGRTEYEITPSGRQRLKANCGQLLEAPTDGDIERVLRTAVLAQLSGAKTRLVTEYLRKAAHARVDLSKQRQQDIAATENAQLYKWMQEVHASARLAMEAQVLRKIASGLNKRS